MDKENLVKDLKAFMVAELKLKRNVDAIGDDAALFGPEGLGIDSLDGIQLGVAAENRYSVRIPIDTDEGKQALSSVNALADYILRARAGS
jgi:acyl carrier protein